MAVFGLDWADIREGSNEHATARISSGEHRHGKQHIVLAISGPGFGSELIAFRLPS